MDLAEIEKRVRRFDYGPDITIEFHLRRNEFEWLISRVKDLETELKLNASMLAKQCDMAREAETRVKEGVMSKIILVGGDPISRMTFEKVYSHLGGKPAMEQEGVMDRSKDQLEIEKRQREKLNVRFAGRKTSQPSADADLMAANDMREKGMMDWKEIEGKIIGRGYIGYEELLLSRVKELELDLTVNASMLAKQCDLARDAEAELSRVEHKRESLEKLLVKDMADNKRLREQLVITHSDLTDSIAENIRMRDAIKYVVNGDIELLDPEIYETLKAALEQNTST